jgi:hypothetical protein
MRLNVFLHLETHLTSSYLAEKGVVDKLLHILALAATEAALIGTGRAVLQKHD